MAGFADYVAFVLCSLCWSPGPCCLASCSAWTRLFVARLCNDWFPGRDSADVCVCVFVFVFLNKVGDVPVVGPHGPYSAEARGASTGAVLGRGYGHCDRCRGRDSANCLEVPQLQLIFKVMTQRLFLMVQSVLLTIEIPWLPWLPLVNAAIIQVVRCLL